MLALPRTWLVAAATAFLACGPVRGDYLYSLDWHGQVSVTTYPTGGDVPSFGQARLRVDSSWLQSSAVQPQGIDAVAFNTDLHLSPSQIVLPAGWTLTPNAVVPPPGLAASPGNCMRLRLA